MTMIEKVARAGYAKWIEMMESRGNKVGEHDFNKLTKLELEWAMAHAKAAIEAMREPTEEMIKIAGNQAYVDAYQEMIDAALKE